MCPYSRRMRCGCQHGQNMCDAWLQLLVGFTRGGTGLCRPDVPRVNSRLGTRTVGKPTKRRRRLGDRRSPSCGFSRGIRKRRRAGERENGHGALARGRYLSEVVSLVYDAPRHRLSSSYIVFHRPAPGASYCARRLPGIPISYSNAPSAMVAPLSTTHLPTTSSSTAPSDLSLQRPTGSS